MIRPLIWKQRKYSVTSLSRTDTRFRDTLPDFANGWPALSERRLQCGKATLQCLVTRAQCLVANTLTCCRGGVAACLDDAGLKEQVRHKIALRPNAIRFVQALRKQGKKLMLVTNAHPGSLALKMRHTGIAAHFDHQISSHRFKLAKENPGFWQALRAHAPYDPDRTLLIDDSLPVLRQAQAEGIAHLRAIHQPDSQRDAVAGEAAFPQIRDFADIMTGPLRE